MKTISVRDLQRQIREQGGLAQRENVVVTRYGKPYLLIVGVEGMDWGDLGLSLDPGFWEMIRQRRAEPGTPLDKAREQLRDG